MPFLFKKIYIFYNIYYSLVQPSEFQEAKYYPFFVFKYSILFLPQFTYPRPLLHMSKTVPLKTSHKSAIY